MQLRRLGIPALVLSALCVHAQDVPIKRKTSEYDSTIVLSTPTISGRSDTSVSQRDDLMVNVQIVKDKATGARQWYLVLQAVYDSIEWRNYRSVSLAGGMQLPGRREPGTVLSCYAGMCRYLEVLIVPMQDQIAKLASVEGLKTRWNAEILGAFELELPAAYFSAVAEAAK